MTKAERLESEWLGLLDLAKAGDRDGFRKAQLAHATNYKRSTNAEQGEFHARLAMGVSDGRC